jgi:hypothetical protein
MMMVWTLSFAIVACVPLLLPSSGIQTRVMPLPVPRLTVDMLDDFPDDGTRYELLEGMLLVTPAPDHDIVIDLRRLFHGVCEEDG